MGDEKFVPETKKTGKLEVSKGIIYAGIALIIILALGIGYLLGNRGNMPNNNDTSTQGVEGAAGVVLEGKDREAELNVVNIAMQAIKSKNLMLNVTDSSNTSVTMVYNSHGEAIAEAPDTGHKTIYLDDNRTIRFSDQIGYGYDSEVLSIMSIALDMAIKDNTIPVLKSNSDEVSASMVSEDGLPEEVEATEIYIDIKGWDKLSELYSTIDATFGELMVSQLKSSIEVAAASNSTISADAELNLRLVYIVADSDIYAGACYIYIGDKDSAEITWDELSYNWIFQSYLELYDWKLPDGWYNTDWSNIESWEEDGEELKSVEELFKNTYDNVLNMMQQFAEDNGITDNIYDIGTSASDLVETEDSEVIDNEN